MEHKRRPDYSAATPQRRPIQYGRVHQAEAGSHQPVITPSISPATVAPSTKQYSFALRVPKSIAKARKFLRLRVIRPVKRAAYRLIATYLNASRRQRAAILVVLFLVIFTTVFPALSGLVDHKTYALSAGENSVLLKTSPSMANKLKYDTKTQAFVFNQDYTPTSADTDSSGGSAIIQASMSEDPTKGITVTDPASKVDLTVVPKFNIGAGKQQENRVVYPAFNGGGHLVYTAGGYGVKQDVTLDHYIGNTLKYDYDLQLGDNYAARLEQNGAIGIYGSSLPITGDVSTGSAEDAALLKKARQAAPKNKLLFILPAPKLVEANGHLSRAYAQYELSGNDLKVVVKNLKTASYPLSVDPTITAASGYGGNGLFSFDANIETNVYVDPSNGFFERSPLTGGNLLTWNTSTGTAGVSNGMPVASHFLGAAAVFASTLYVIGGTTTASSTTNITSSNTYVEQAPISSSGSVGVFTKGNSTNLPAGGLSRFKLLTYNGYMYVVDGSTTNTTGAALSDAVYYTRITSESYASGSGAQLTNWSTATNKPTTALYDYAATVYNGYIYVSGGLNQGSTTAQSAVLYAPLLPNGDTGTFNTTTALTGTRFGHDMQAYNGHLYVLGGNTNTIASPTLTASTLYASVTDTGTIADSSWKTGTSLVTTTGTGSQVMENFGTGFSMVYNGYLYVTGGCTVATTTDTCGTTAGNVADYTQLAQMNADGSLGTFFPNDFQNGGTASLPRVGTATVGFNGNLYSVGGCTAMSTTVSCTALIASSSYASVNGTTTATAASGVGDISGNRNPGDLPTGLYGHSTTVLNGYLYLIGGCLSLTCNGNRVVNYNTYYTKIAADGTLVNPSTLLPTSIWVTNTVATNATALNFPFSATNGNSSDNDCSTGGTDRCGLAGAAVTTYNGMIYVIGGGNGNTTAGSSPQASVFYQRPSATTGAPVAWTKSGVTITNAAIELGAFSRNNSLYVIGGCSGAVGVGCSTYQSQVMRIPLNADGSLGTVNTTQLQLPTTGSLGRAAFGLALSGNYIYLAGGIRSGGTATDSQLASVTRAKINSSGDIVNVSTGLTSGTWTDCTGSLTSARRRLVATVLNGYLYVIAGHNAADTTGGQTNGTTYGDIQIAKIDMSTAGTGDIAGDASTHLFTKTSTGALTPRWDSSLAVGAGFIFVTGGCTGGVNNYPPANCVTEATTDESFVVYNANSLGVNTWNAPTAYTTNRIGASSTVYNGYLYVTGGCTTYTMSTLACSAVNATTYFAPINADGSLGAWSNGAGAFDLPAGRAFGQLMAVNGNLYYIGGQDATGTNGAQTAVYKSTIGASGVPGAFSATGQTALATGTGTGGLTQAAATTYAGIIFLAGGFTGTGGINSALVYRSTINGSGNITAWTATTSGFTTGRRELSIVSAGAYLYVIGGYDGTNYYADVQLATPNTSTGQIASWSKVEEVPYAEGGMSAVGANGYISVFGGRNGNTSTSCSASVYQASINGDGTIGHWQQAPNSLTTARFGAATNFYNGYLFVNGGHNCTNIIDGTSGTKIVEQSGQLSEAIHSTYTRYIDFGTNATFRQLYVLGTNAAISGTDIDIWKISVKTSTTANASTGYGQAFNTSLTGLTTGPAYGTPITFQALDSSGVNQGAAQYWSIKFDIDQAQSFNFPDGNQPQITKYDLYFSPGPAKRLRDGKTFVNEIQTNLDAHP